MSAHRHQTYKPGCFRCDLGLDEEGGHVVAIHRDDLRALMAPAIDQDDDLDDIANDAGTNDGRAIVWAINELTRALKAATS